MSQALLAFDTDQLKEYAFATGVLRDIRGASASLEDLIGATRLVARRARRVTFDRRRVSEVWAA